MNDSVPSFSFKFKTYEEFLFNGEAGGEAVAVDSTVGFQDSEYAPVVDERLGVGSPGSSGVLKEGIFSTENDGIYHNGFEKKDFDQRREIGEWEDAEEEEEDEEEGLRISEYDEQTELETLWEHQELIEQLRMELKKVKATGLPTILEEAEYPKEMEDLKPWKIEERIQREDRIGDLHKLNKSYRERMRKLDILNYQKMYAMGLLQLKDPLQMISREREGGFWHNLRLFKPRKVKCGPMTKFSSELYGDLETVYVGQMCLSWEFLHWQYQKTLELWESDTHGKQTYNEVAGEFQQFQILLHRFMENEPFQGPRVHNFVKNRCLLRSLLQVPLIRGDSHKNGNNSRGRSQGGDCGAITIDTLVEIMEESIRVFWRFVRADKYAVVTGAFDKRVTSSEELEDSDIGLFIDNRITLEKKDKKLGGILRTRKCVLRRMKKGEEEDNTDQVLCFFSQVDLRLVGRVLNMSNLSREQLLWCHSKLAKLNVTNRRIQVEPSFLLFPC